jgi:hypothetical protein
MTTDSRGGHLLENDPRNPCIGCGPTNPRGLRLEFRRDGEKVVTELIAHETMEGWPGRLHSGLLYLAMLDVANWTVYGLHGRVGLPVQTSALTLLRWVPTGTRLRLVGAQDSGTADLTIRVEALDGERPVARLDRSYILANRAEFERRLGYETLPEVLREVVPE